MEETAKRELHMDDLQARAETMTKLAIELRGGINEVLLALLGHSPAGGAATLDEKPKEGPRGRMLRIHNEMEKGQDTITQCFNIVNRLRDRVCSKNEPVDDCPFDEKPQ